MRSTDAHEEKGNTGMTGKGTGNDTRFEITLNDYHPGEYTSFDSAAADRRAMLARFNDGAGEGTPKAGPGPEVEMIEGDEDAEEYELDRWIIRGDIRDHRALLSDLLGRLIAPAWDWYGMGGDDHCYDYWPNTMTLAADYRDALAESGMLDAEESLRLNEELRRVYWLCRMRYANDRVGKGAEPGPLLMMKGSPAENEADAYFESDILSSEGFGARIWS